MDENQRARAYTCIVLRDLFLKCALAVFILWLLAAAAGISWPVGMGIVGGLLLAATLARFEAGTYGYGEKRRG